MRKGKKISLAVGSGLNEEPISNAERIMPEQALTHDLLAHSE
jgi:hypothetical protein